MDTFTVDGFTFAIETDIDSDMGPPWKENDVHGPVRETSSREDKRAGERMLISERGRHGYAYNVQEATRIAKRDGWGLGDDDRAKLAARLQREPTPGDITAAAVEHDFQYLRAWCNDEWQWLTVHVTLLDVDGDKTGADDYLGGVESSTDDYVAECARDMAHNIIAAHNLSRRKFLQDGASRTRLKA